MGAEHSRATLGGTDLADLVVVGTGADLIGQIGGVRHSSSPFDRVRVDQLGKSALVETGH